MAAPRGPARTAQRSPDAAPILRLPQETLDTICASIRDDDEAADREVIATLCSLARTARCFRWLARRALLHDPTRALIGSNAAARIEMFLERILLNPPLGMHVLRLDRLADLPQRIYYDEFGANFPPEDFYYDEFRPRFSPRQFSNHVLALAQNTPNLTSISVDPYTAITPCFRHLARLPHVQEIHLASILRRFREADDGSACWSFLAALERSRLHSLALARFRDSVDLAEDVSHTLNLEVEQLSIADWVITYGIADWVMTYGGPDRLDHFFDFGRVRSFTHNPKTSEGLQLSLVRHFTDSLERLRVAWPEVEVLPQHSARWELDLAALPTCASVTHLSFRRVLLHAVDLEKIAQKFPRLESLDLSACQLHDCCMQAPNVVLDTVETLPRLRDFRFRSVTLGDSQDLYRLANHCAARGIEFRGGMP